MDPDRAAEADRPALVRWPGWDTAGTNAGKKP